MKVLTLISLSLAIWNTELSAYYKNLTMIKLCSGFINTNKEVRVNIGDIGFISPEAKVGLGIGIWDIIFSSERIKGKYNNRLDVEKEFQIKTFFPISLYTLHYFEKYDDYEETVNMFYTYFKFSNWAYPTFYDLTFDTPNKSTLWDIGLSFDRSILDSYIVSIKGGYSSIKIPEFSQKVENEEYHFNEFKSGKYYIGIELSIGKWFCEEEKIPSESAKPKSELPPKVLLPKPFFLDVPIKPPPPKPEPLPNPPQTIYGFHHRWTAAESPYIITSNFVVDKDATLIIEPGVTIKFEKDCSLIVYGILIAKGDPDKQIIFTSNQPSPKPQDWGEIRFKDSSMDAEYDKEHKYIAGCILEYCRIKYGKGIVRDNANPRIDNIKIVF